MSGPGPDEAAVGAHPANAAAARECELFYRRERNREVDFVVTAGRRVAAVEVKSDRRTDALPGMTAFAERFEPHRRLLVGDDGIPLEDSCSNRSRSGPAEPPWPAAACPAVLPGPAHLAL